jgi:hypothetical protein
MHKGHKTACTPDLDARPDLDTQTAAVSSFHNCATNTLLEITEIKWNLMYHHGNKYVSLNINMGCANNNRIKWQITVAVSD